MNTKKSKIRYREKLTIREKPLLKTSPEETLNTIADIILERMFEENKDIRKT